MVQPGCFALLKALCDLGYKVSLETSRALDISAVDPRVIKNLDVKTPGSNETSETSRNKFENFNYLSSDDQIKFVICDRHDYEWAKLVF
ncbi:hypothetical protein [Candidatus Coxiella mudrowiae]|uniref:hypothetical protein n=1 Tax=Candidatus Coxiella mudrowiae TaxID=2054173 RepID=UPI001F20E64D